MAERGSHSLKGREAGDASRVVRLARPTARTLPPAANDNPTRARRGAFLIPLLVAAAAAILLLAGIAG